MQRTKEVSGITALVQMQAFVRMRTFLMYKKKRTVKLMKLQSLSYSPLTT